jgi:hypothetical protein
VLTPFGIEIYLQLKTEWEKTSQELTLLLKGDGTDENN